MIRIDKSTVTKPSVLDDDTIKKHLKKRILEKKPGENIGKPYNHEEVRKTLIILYKNKCAYCEGKIKVSNSTPRIEHYRPKNGIKSVDNHKGYYWLGYEWTNLLLACEVCNNSTYKSNKFPLEDESTRVSDDLKKERFIDTNDEFQLDKFQADSDILSKEKRLLLNPEIDDVYAHLYFTPEGVIKARNNSKMGETSIKVYGLNRSNQSDGIDLIKDRRIILVDLINELLKFFERFDEKDYPQHLKYFFDDHIKNIDKPEKEFSRFGYFIKNHFDIFIVEQFRRLGLIQISKILEDTYNDWKVNQ